MSRRTAVLLALLLALGAGPAAAEDTVLADVQLRTLAGERFLLHLRASGPQAFDVLPGEDPRVFRVRLYHARLGELAPLVPASFGTVSLAAEPAGHVLVTLDLADPGWRVTATQGASPHAVDIRVERPD